MAHWRRFSSSENTAEHENHDPRRDIAHWRRFSSSENTAEHENHDPRRDIAHWGRFSSENIAEYENHDFRRDIAHWGRFSSENTAEHENHDLRRDIAHWRFSSENIAEYENHDSRRGMAHCRRVSSSENIAEDEKYDAGQHMPHWRSHSSSTDDTLSRTSTWYESPRHSRSGNHAALNCDRNSIPPLFPKDDDGPFFRGTAGSEEIDSRGPRSVRESRMISRYSPAFDLRECLNPPLPFPGRSSWMDTADKRLLNSPSSSFSGLRHLDSSVNTGEKSGWQHDHGRLKVVPPQINPHPISPAVRKRFPSQRRSIKRRNSYPRPKKSACLNKKWRNILENYSRSVANSKRVSRRQPDLHKQRLNSNKVQTNGKSKTEVTVVDRSPVDEVAKFQKSEIAGCDDKVDLQPSSVTSAQEKVNEEIPSTDNEVSSSTRDCSNGETASQPPEEKSDAANGSLLGEGMPGTQDEFLHNTASSDESTPSISQSSCVEEKQSDSCKGVSCRGLLAQKEMKGKSKEKVSSSQCSDVSDFEETVTSLQSVISIAATSETQERSPSVGQAAPPTTVVPEVLASLPAARRTSCEKKVHRLVVLCCRNTAEVLSSLLQHISTKFIYFDHLNAASHTEFFTTLEAELKTLDSVPCLVLLGSDVLCDVSLHTCCCSSSCALEIQCAQLQLFTSQLETKSDEILTHTEVLMENFVSGLKLKFDDIFRETNVVYLFDRPIVTCPVDWSWSTIHRLKQELPNLRLVPRETFGNLKTCFDEFLRLYNTLLISRNKYFSNDSSNAVMDLVKLRPCVDPNEKVSTSEKTWLGYVENVLMNLGLLNNCAPAESSTKSCSPETKPVIPVEILCIKKEREECIPSPPSDVSENNEELYSKQKGKPKHNRIDTVDNNLSEKSVITKGNNPSQESLGTIDCNLSDQSGITNADTSVKLAVESGERFNTVVKNEPLTALSIKKEPVLFEEEAFENLPNMAKFTDTLAKPDGVNRELVPSIKSENHADNTVIFDSLLDNVPTPSISSSVTDDLSENTIIKVEHGFEEVAEITSELNKKIDGQLICKTESSSHEENAGNEVDPEKAEVGSEKAEVGSEKAEVGSEKAEVGSEKAEVGSEKAEVGSEKVEVGSEKAEDNFEKAEDNFENAEKNAENTVAACDCAHVSIPITPNYDSSLKSPDRSSVLEPRSATDETNDGDDANFLYQFSADLIAKKSESDAATSASQLEMMYDSQSSDEDLGFLYDLTLARSEPECDHETIHGTTGLLAVESEPSSYLKSTLHAKNSVISREHLPKTRDKDLSVASGQLKKHGEISASISLRNNRGEKSRETSVLQNEPSASHKHSRRDENSNCTGNSDEQTRLPEISSFSETQKSKKTPTQSVRHVIEGKKKSKTNISYFVSKRSLIIRSKECPTVTRDAKANSKVTEQCECVTRGTVSTDGRLSVTISKEKFPCVKVSTPAKITPFYLCKDVEGHDNIFTYITVWDFPRRCPIRIRQAIFLVCGAQQCYFDEHKASQCIRSVFRTQGESERCYRILNGACLRFNGTKWLLLKASHRRSGADFMSVLSADIHPKPVPHRVLSPEETLADNKLFSKIQDGLHDFFNIIVAQTEGQTSAGNIFETGLYPNTDSTSNSSSDNKSVTKKCKRRRNSDSNESESLSDGKVVTPLKNVQDNSASVSKSSFPSTSTSNVPISTRKSINGSSFVGSGVCQSGMKRPRLSTSFSPKKSSRVGEQSQEGLENRLTKSDDSSWLTAQNSTSKKLTLAKSCSNLFETNSNSTILHNSTTSSLTASSASSWCISVPSAFDQAATLSDPNYYSVSDPTIPPLVACSHDQITATHSTSSCIISPSIFRSDYLKYISTVSSPVITCSSSSDLIVSSNKSSMVDASSTTRVISDTSVGSASESHDNKQSVPTAIDSFNNGSRRTITSCSSIITTIHSSKDSFTITDDSLRSKRSSPEILAKFVSPLTSYETTSDVASVLNSSDEEDSTVAASPTTKSLLSSSTCSQNDSGSQRSTSKSNCPDFTTNFQKDCGSQNSTDEVNNSVPMCSNTVSLLKRSSSSATISQNATAQKRYSNIVDNCTVTTSSFKTPLMSSTNVPNNAGTQCHVKKKNSSATESVSTASVKSSMSLTTASLIQKTGDNAELRNNPVSKVDSSLVTICTSTPVVYSSTTTSRNLTIPRASKREDGVSLPLSPPKPSATYLISHISPFVPRSLIKSLAEACDCSVQTKCNSSVLKAMVHSAPGETLLLKMSSHLTMFGPLMRITTADGETPPELCKKNSLSHLEKAKLKQVFQEHALSVQQRLALLIEKEYDPILFKTRKCSTSKCNRDNCPKYHSDRDRRRNILTFPHQAVLCNLAKEPSTGKCRYGDHCHQSQNRYESLYHPFYFQSVCKRSCTAENLCPHRHPGTAVHALTSPEPLVYCLGHCYTLFFASAVIRLCSSSAALWLCPRRSSLGGDTRTSSRLKRSVRAMVVLEKSYVCSAFVRSLNDLAREYGVVISQLVEIFDRGVDSVTLAPISKNSNAHDTDIVIGSADKVSTWLDCHPAQAVSLRYLILEYCDNDLNIRSMLAKLRHATSLKNMKTVVVGERNSASYRSNISSLFRQQHLETALLDDGILKLCASIARSLDDSSAALGRNEPSANQLTRVAQVGHSSPTEVVTSSSDDHQMSSSRSKPSSSSPSSLTGKSRQSSLTSGVEVLSVDVVQAPRVVSKSSGSKTVATLRNSQCSLTLQSEKHASASKKCKKFKLQSLSKPKPSDGLMPNISTSCSKSDGRKSTDGISSSTSKPSLCSNIELCPPLQKTLPYQAKQNHFGSKTTEQILAPFLLKSKLEIFGTKQILPKKSIVGISPEKSVGLSSPPQGTLFCDTSSEADVKPSLDQSFRAPHDKSTINCNAMEDLTHDVPTVVPDCVTTDLSSTQSSSVAIPKSSTTSWKKLSSSDNQGSTVSTSFSCSKASSKSSTKLNILVPPDSNTPELGVRPNATHCKEAICETKPCVALPAMVSSASEVGTRTSSGWLIKPESCASAKESSNPASRADLLNVDGKDDTIETEDSFSDCEKRNCDLRSRTESIFTRYSNLPGDLMSDSVDVSIENEKIFLDIIKVNSSYLDDSQDSQDSDMKKPIHEKIRLLHESTLSTIDSATQRENILGSNTGDSGVLPNSESRHSINELSSKTTVSSKSNESKKNWEPQLENHGRFSMPDLANTILPSDTAAAAVTRIPINFPVSTASETNDNSGSDRLQILSKDASFSPSISKLSSTKSCNLSFNCKGIASDHLVSQNAPKPIAYRPDQPNSKLSCEGDMKKKTTNCKHFSTVEAVTFSESAKLGLPCPRKGTIEISPCEHLSSDKSAREPILSSLMMKKLSTSSDVQTCVKKSSVQSVNSSKSLGSGCKNTTSFDINEGSATLQASTSTNVQSPIQLTTNVSAASKKSNLSSQTSSNTTSNNVDGAFGNEHNQKSFLKSRNKFEALAQILLDKNDTVSDSPNSAADSRLLKKDRNPTLERLSDFQSNCNQSLSNDDVGSDYEGIEAIATQLSSTSCEVITTKKLSKKYSIGRPLKSTEIFISGQMPSSECCNTSPEIKPPVRTTSKKINLSGAQDAQQSSSTSRDTDISTTESNSSISVSSETNFIPREILNEKNSTKILPSSILCLSRDSYLINQPLAISPIKVSTEKRPMISTVCSTKNASPKRQKLSADLQNKLGSEKTMPSEKMSTELDKRSSTKKMLTNEKFADGKLHPGKIFDRKLDSNIFASDTDLVLKKRKRTASNVKSRNCISSAESSESIISTTKEGSVESVTKKRELCAKSSSSEVVISKKLKFDESISYTDPSRNSHGTKKSSIDKKYLSKNVNIMNHNQAVSTKFLTKQNVTKACKDKILKSVVSKAKKSSTQKIKGESMHLKCKSIESRGFRVKSLPKNVDEVNNMDLISTSQQNSKLKVELSLFVSNENSSTKRNQKNSALGLVAQVSLGKNERLNDLAEKKASGKCSPSNALASKALSSVKDSSGAKSARLDDESSRVKLKVSEEKQIELSTLASANKACDDRTSCPNNLVVPKRQKKLKDLKLAGNEKNIRVSKNKIHACVDGSVKNVSAKKAFQKPNENLSDQKLTLKSVPSKTVNEIDCSEKKYSYEVTSKIYLGQNSGNSENRMSSKMFNDIQCEFSVVKEFLECNSMSSCVHELFGVYVKALECMRNTGDQEALKKAVDQLRLLSGREISRIAESEYVEFLKVPESSPRYDSQRQKYALLEDKSVPWEAFWRRKMEFVREDKIAQLKRSWRSTFRRCHQKCLAIIDELKDKHDGALKLDEKEIDRSCKVNKISSVDPDEGNNVEIGIQKNFEGEVTISRKTDNESKHSGCERIAKYNTKPQKHEIDSQEQVNFSEQKIKLPGQNESLSKENESQKPGPHTTEQNVQTLDIPRSCFKAQLIQQSDPSSEVKIQNSRQGSEPEHSTKSSWTENAESFKKRLRTTDELNILSGTNKAKCKSNSFPEDDGNSPQSGICVTRKFQINANDENVGVGVTNLNSNIKRGNKRARRSSNKENSPERNHVEQKPIPPESALDIDNFDPSIVSLIGSSLSTVNIPKHQVVPCSGANLDVDIQGTSSAIPKTDVCESNISIDIETLNTAFSEIESLKKQSVFSSVEASTSFGTKRETKEVVVALRKASLLIDELSACLVQLACDMEKGKTLSFDDEPEIRLVLECARDRLQHLAFEEPTRDLQEEHANAARILGNFIVASRSDIYRRATVSKSICKHTHENQLFIGRSGLPTSLRLKLGVSTPKMSCLDLEQLATATEHNTAKQLWQAVKAAVDKAVNTSQPRSSVTPVDYASVFMEVSSIHALKILNGKSI
ncbi:hypothetical protein FHG87_008295 [Trinorchestia longiramus]|nr:hypothetical protein FHG87_008295 [Trinorchestia longiramus]